MAKRTQTKRLDPDVDTVGRQNMPNHSFSPGQGDNHLVLLKIPPNHLLRAEGVTENEYVDNFVQVLVRYTDEAGIPIKPLETWQSHQLFEYSRKYHY